MSSRVRSVVGARVRPFALRWSELTGASQERAALRAELQHLGTRLDALEAVFADMWRRGELAADNRALGLQDLALTLQAQSEQKADHRHQQALDAAERSADALVVNVRRAVEASADELRGVAEDLRAATQALDAGQAGPTA